MLSIILQNTFFLVKNTLSILSYHQYDLERHFAIPSNISKNCEY